jgi:lipoyl(octanoyl) transferase
MITWQIEQSPVDYHAALTAMEQHVAAMADGTAPEKIWLLEHPPLYTAGTSADPVELINPRFPVYEAGRGGRYTYHGPGQRVAYVMLDLRTRGNDLRAYVKQLEMWAQDALMQFGVKAETREGRVGLWVKSGLREEKIAAIGVRVRKWITFHGISINRDPDLSHFAGIVPCGLSDYGVTSLKALGINASQKQLDDALKTAWRDRFSAELSKTA